MKEILLLLLGGVVGFYWGAITMINHYINKQIKRDREQPAPPVEDNLYNLKVLGHGNAKQAQSLANISHTAIIDTPKDKLCQN